MLTNEQLAEWQAFCDAATPPPWFVVGSTDEDGAPLLDDDGNVVLVGVGWEAPHDAREADCRFVAAAREALPVLLAEARRLRALVQEAPNAL